MVDKLDEINGTAKIKSNYIPVRISMVNSITASLWAMKGAGAEQLFCRIKHIEQLLLAIILVMLARWWCRYRKLIRTSGTGEKRV